MGESMNLTIIERRGRERGFLCQRGDRWFYRMPWSWIRSKPRAVSADRAGRILAAAMAIGAEIDECHLPHLRAGLAKCASRHVMTDRVT